LEEAILTLNRAIELKPDFADAYIELGNAFSDQSKFIEANECFARATRCDPKSPEAFYNLGNSLTALDRFDEALAAYQTAIGLKPDFALAHCNLGIAYSYKGEFQSAIRTLEATVQISPISAIVHHALADNLLRLGDFRRGLPEYEWRDEPVSTFVSKTSRRWDGGDIRGRTILIHGEQGFGDNLQFVRYVPMIAERWGGVIMGC
jgi:tetratricopeptide (TPR) repeat protein